ncbi:MAG TPA: glycosyltransferase family 4 protein [Nitrospirales bacterium]|nr:glycosyltransferase family 4 protein [Nitrospirales bacterium]HIO22317.1 glycosyltransferase family 4 protein [Nitrospirales bacterium]
MTRLTFIVSSLAHPGGAQRVMSIMANYWATKGWSITLLTMDDGSESPFYDLHPAVKHHALDIAGESSNPIEGLINNLNRLQVLRRAIKESDVEVVISFIDQTNVLTLLSTWGMYLPVVIAERIDPTHYHIGTGWNLLRKWVNPRASYVVTQTEAALSYFSERVRKKAWVIPNPVVLQWKPQKRAISFINNKRKKSVLSVGRLSEQKGFDLLLRAFAMVSPRHTSWSLIVWGEGSSRACLEKLRDDLGLYGRVYFPGKTKHPFEKMRQADLFVLSSRYEGFPNVLLEAMACGLPVISADCPSGPREIIRDDVNGILVPPENVEGLAYAMDRLMSDETERRRLSLRAVEVRERFGLETIMEQWEQLIGCAIGNRSTPH